MDNSGPKPPNQAKMKMMQKKLHNLRFEKGRFTNRWHHCGCINFFLISGCFRSCWALISLCALSQEETLKVQIPNQLVLNFRYLKKASSLFPFFYTFTIFLPPAFPCYSNTLHTCKTHTHTRQQMQPTHT